MPLHRHRVSLLDRLRPCWSLPNADPDLQRRLFLRQAQHTSVTWWLHDLTFVIGALFVLIVYGGRQPDWSVWWLSGLTLLSLGHMQARRMSQSRKGSQGVPTIRLGTLMAWMVPSSITYSAGMGQLYLHGPDEVRMMVAASSATAMVSGATRYARLPQLSILWMLIGLLFANHALWSIGRVVDLCFAAGINLFFMSLVSSVMATSRHFVQTTQAEFEAQRERELMRLLLRDVEGASSDWFWECDLQGRLTYVSTRLNEADPHITTHPTLSDVLVGLGGRPHDIGALVQTFGQDRPFRDQVVELAGPDGPQWRSFSGKPLFDINGRVSGWRGVAVDVSADRQHQQTLSRLAATDTLTGLVNRHGFNEFLARHLPDQPVALLMLDLGSVAQTHEQTP